MISVRKSPNMMSTTGRMPLMAAPRPRPEIPASEIGESMTRCGPNSSTSPASTLNGWPASAMSSPIRNTVGSRRSSSASASLTACAIVSSRVALTTALGEDILGDLTRVGIRRVEGVRDGIGDLRVDALAERRNGRVVADACREQLDRVPFGHPELFLFLRAVVGAVDVADVMAVVAVCRREVERRAVPGARSVDSAPCGCAHCENVLPVDLLGRNAECLRACGYRARRDFGDVRVLVVEVVLADVDDGQLPERGHVHDLVEEPLSERSVPEEADCDAVRAEPLRSEGRAGGDPRRSADDCVSPEIPMRVIGDVHRAALAPAVALLLAEQLAEHPLDVRALRNA